MNSSRNVILYKTNQWLRYDVFCVQEVRGVQGDISELRKKYASHHFVASFCGEPNSGNRDGEFDAGGVLIDVSKTFAKQFHTLIPVVFEHGRSICLLCGGLQKSLIVSNIHVVPDWPLHKK